MVREPAERQAAKGRAQHNVWDKPRSSIMLGLVCFDALLGGFVL